MLSLDWIYMRNRFTRALAGFSAVALSTVLAPAAFAVGPLTDALAAVDLAGVATAVAAIALIVIAIKLTFKGPDVAGRVIRKV